MPGSVIIILVIGLVFRSFAAGDPLIQDGLTRYGILQARIEQIATDAACSWSAACLRRMKWRR